MWFIGDQFLTRTFQPYFMHWDEKVQGFVLENFQVMGYMNSKFTCNDRSVLSRVRNCLVYGLNNNYLLPKAIVLVIDNDIIKNVEFEGYGISVLLGKILQWLASEIVKLIAAYKDKMPEKAKKEFFPQILWIEPPLHKNFGKSENFRRKKFASCIQSVSKSFQMMTVLQLRKIWDYDDSNLFIMEPRRFTSEGYNLYFKAVDAVLKVWDNFLFQKLLKRSLKPVVKDKKTMPKEEKERHLTEKSRDSAVLISTGHLLGGGIPEISFTGTVVVTRGYEGVKPSMDTPFRRKLPTPPPEQ